MQDKKIINHAEQNNTLYRCKYVKQITKIVFSIKMFKI